MTIYDMGIRFTTAYQPITIAVDNNSALNVGLIFTNKITSFDQHYDVIQSIRELQDRISTTFIPTRVKRHQEDKVHWSKFNRLERLNVECDHLAKHARTHMSAYPQLMPSLQLPYERISIYHEDVKIYKNFQIIMIEKCNVPRIQTYYCCKYNWNRDQFDSMNWEATSLASSRI